MKCLDTQTIFVPKDVWGIILGYLETQQLEEDLNKQQLQLKEEKEFIDETFVFTNSRLKNISKNLRRIRRKLDNCVSFLEYSKAFDSLTSDMDGYTLDLRGEIHSLYSVIQNLNDVSHELNYN